MLLMPPDTLIKNRFKLKEIQQQALTRLGLNTLTDLLLYLPSRYQIQGEARQIKELVVGEKATIVGKVTSAKTSKAYRQKTPMGEITIQDETGKIKAVWFNQPYLAKKFAVGEIIQLTGKVTERSDKLYLANPEINGADYIQSGQSLFAKNQEEILTPVYSETKGLSSGWFYHHIQKLLAEKIHEKIVDPLPKVISQRYNLPSLATALIWIHLPQKVSKAESAKKRFAFEEIFFIQLARLKSRQQYQTAKSYNIKINQKDLNTFTKHLPFTLTGAQNKAIDDILSDLEKDTSMMRLLEGDVGSGKTAVAAATAYTVVKAGLSVAYMAPTEILAKQHFESFIQNFIGQNITIGLLTGKQCRKFPSKINPKEHTKISRSQLLKWVAEGQIPILIGTHALIQKSVKFKNLAYVVIDEQHRFGIKQRSELVKKNDGQAPHLLSMTATPIPRTLALTAYGDLDLTLLDEMPGGRKKIITTITSEDKRDEMYEALRQELQAGRQAYVICPRIDEPDPDKALALNAKAAKTEQKNLARNIFPEYKIGLMHSRLKPHEKEETMQAFTDGEINILVATSVVEVGVNVPNATVIIIEGAERYGLAQLHQLRGRVMRSTHQSHCYLLSKSTSSLSVKRLKSLIQAKNGFELAELDLSLRGAGALIGGKQWGISDIGMDAIKNLKLVEAARLEAQKIVAIDPDLDKYPLLKKKTLKPAEIHFE